MNDYGFFCITKIQWIAKQSTARRKEMKSVCVRLKSMVVTPTRGLVLETETKYSRTAWLQTFS